LADFSIKKDYKPTPKPTKKPYQINDKVSTIQDRWKPSPEKQWQNYTFISEIAIVRLKNFDYQ